MAARYDRTAACQVFDGIADRALALRIGLEYWDSMFSDESIFEAAAVVRPERTAAIIDALPDSTGDAKTGLKDRARLAVARILARPLHERSLLVERNLLHLWPIDSEED
jgi:hypothetical protein